MPLDVLDGNETGQHGLPVQTHRAATAAALAAARLRPSHAELVAEHRLEGLERPRQRRHRLAVQLEAHRPRGHRASSPSALSRACRTHTAVIRRRYQALATGSSTGDASAAAASDAAAIAAAS